MCDQACITQNLHYFSSSTVVLAGAETVSGTNGHDHTAQQVNIKHWEKVRSQFPSELFYLEKIIQSEQSKNYFWIFCRFNPFSTMKSFYGLFG